MITKIKGKKRKRLKVRFCDKMLWSRFLATLGVISTLVTFTSFFVTAADIDINTWCLVGLFAILIIGIFCIMWRNANQKRSADLNINNTHVRVFEGDIFELFEKDPSDRTDEICVIGANNYFDVIVDNRIISANSLHGQYIRRISMAGQLDALNYTIEHNPIMNSPENRTVDSNRAVGKKIRYEIGSIVEFESYILSAFTKFNVDNEAWLTAEEYTSFWMRFWMNIDKIYAGRTINIPLMGAGITRFKNGKPSKQELLEMMLLSLKMSGFHNTYSDRYINFVIYSGDVDEIDFYHIQHNPSFR